MNAHRFARLLGTAVVTTSAALLNAPIFITPASAAPCPDAEVTFARGTDEPPGVGAVGDAFVNSLRGKTRKSIGV
ncbi:cutinase family protein, partial [Mycobacterium sp. E3247]|uniref:cutinase family protein n=1 Tax=Mycobacterium sp. E3247 TaxID=1856864 RepID=UPI0012EA3CC2